MWSRYDFFYIILLNSMHHVWLFIIKRLWKSVTLIFIYQHTLLKYVLWKWKLLYVIFCSCGAVLTWVTICNIFFLISLRSVCDCWKINLKYYYGTVLFHTFEWNFKIISRSWMKQVSKDNRLGLQKDKVWLLL